MRGFPPATPPAAATPDDPKSAHRKSADRKPAAGEAVDRSRSAARRRRQTTIQRAACHLVLERGYDGFTMTELAQAVGVSRRTLFNSVPDKESAVLGCADPEDSLAADVFRRGGPTGKLTEDFVQTVSSLLTEDFGTTPAAAMHHQLVQRAIASDPKLLSLALERFEAMATLLASLLSEREGWEADDLRARTFAATFMALVKVCFDEAVRRPSPPEFIDIFREVLAAEAAVRSL